MVLIYSFCRKEKNLVEALAAGASMSITLVANIAVNLMAFVAVLALVDAILMWFGGMVGVPTLSFSVSIITFHYHCFIDPVHTNCPELPLTPASIFL